MNPTELDVVKQLFIELIEYIMKYSSNNLNNECRVLQSTINIIESDMSDMEKSKKVINNYKALFLSEQGLSEYNIWDDDFHKRTAINKPLDDIRDNLWIVMGKYI